MNTSNPAVPAESKPRSVFDEIHSSTRQWWLLLITGIAWIVIAVVILRFNYATVAAIAALFGVFSLVAAANEVVVGMVSSTGWRILHWLLAAVFVVVGVLAFVYPADTFVALAAVMSFYFDFRGAFDIAMALTGNQGARLVGTAGGGPCLVAARVLGGWFVESVGGCACLLGWPPAH